MVMASLGFVRAGRKRSRAGQGIGQDDEGGGVVMGSLGLK